MIKFVHALLNDKRFRFAISGSLGFLVYMGLLAGFFQLPFTQTSTFNIIVTNIIVTELSMLFAFRMHNHFTWQHDKAHSFAKRFLHFHIASGIGLALRHLSFGIMVSIDIDKYIAGAVSSILAAVVNYFCYDRVVFKAAQDD